MRLIPAGLSDAYYDAPDDACYTPEQERAIESGAWDPEEKSWKEYCDDVSSGEALREADL